MTLELDMKYNHLSDHRPFEPCIEVYILLLSQTNLWKTEDAAMGGMVSALIFNLHAKSYSNNVIMLPAKDLETLCIWHIHNLGLQKCW